MVFPRICYNFVDVLSNVFQDFPQEYGILIVKFKIIL